MTSGPCITLASYNMHKAVGLDGRRDPHRVLKVLQEIDADIVALQEADKRVGGRASTVPHALIDSHGLYKPVHFGVRHKRMFVAVVLGVGGWLGSWGVTTSHTHVYTVSPYKFPYLP